ncbi:Domain of uncharacterised function (DUF2825) [Salmonella enterica subsp. enterica]|nr:unnamed protein product [Salmonella enterica subsp. enterica serovar Senftenberg]SUG92063.1 Domain of uncharacterised function (DUF2825) [Salmonella enterica subsp. enterica]
MLGKRVYPRWRGEHPPSPLAAHWSTGLSPLARGTHKQRPDDRPVARFIPAGAGNTMMPIKCKKRGAVYPRWRGEHGWSGWYPGYNPGLSPLARGTRKVRQRTVADWRFIPAGVGNTLRDVHRTADRTVYPRWRGEHGAARVSRLLSIGLSPLARGTHGWPSSCRGTPRFIPAGAGSTLIQPETD